MHNPVDNPLSTIPGDIIGLRRNGAPIRLIAGASPDDPSNEPSGDPPDDLSGQLAAALADAEKWKALSRKHETNAKSNADKATRLDAVESEHAAALAALTGERDTLSTEVTGLRAGKIRSDAAAAAGLAADMVQFITATTAEDAKTQAETLATKMTGTGHDQGVRDSRAPEPGTGVARLRYAYSERENAR